MLSREPRGVGDAIGRDQRPKTREHPADLFSPHRPHEDAVDLGQQVLDVRPVGNERLDVTLASSRCRCPPGASDSEPHGMAWKILFSVRMKSPDCIGIEDGEERLRARLSKAAKSLAPGGLPARAAGPWPRRRRESYAEPELKRAPGDRRRARTPRIRPLSALTKLVSANPGRDEGAVGGGRARHIHNVEGVAPCASWKRTAPTSASGRSVGAASRARPA